jgi:hypothetical protein
MTAPPASDRTVLIPNVVARTTTNPKSVKTKLVAFLVCCISYPPYHLPASDRTIICAV